jgi:hypothetical protein
MPGCTTQQQTLDNLKSQLADLQGSPDGAPHQKPPGAAINALRQRIAVAQTALNECLNPTIRGTVTPKYVVVALMYAPPGKGSEVTYGVGSTAGGQVEVTNSFKTGLTISTSEGALGSGVDVSFGASAGTKSGTSIEFKKEASSTIKLTSAVDGVDHSKDTFFVWTNVAMDGTEKANNLALVLRTSGPGTAMNIIPLTLGELLQPSTIPASKMQRLPGFATKDFDSIRTLHPFPGGQVQSAPLDPGRFSLITQLQVDGPDHIGDPLTGQGIDLSFERSVGTITGTTAQLNVGVTVTAGVTFVAEAKVALGATFEWDYEAVTHADQGSKEEVGVTLQSETIGFHEVVDVYQDAMFGSLAFVSRGTFSAGNESVTGLVKGPFLVAGAPAPSQRVDVELANGVTRTVFTNAQGVYRLFDVPNGTTTVSSGNTKQTITKAAGRPITVDLAHH